VDLPSTTEDPAVFDATAEALAGLRGAKSVAKVSMRTEVTRATVAGPADRLRHLEKALDDLRAAGRVTGELVLTGTDGADGADGAELSITAELALAD
jgi:valyl-tRNA synthetase